MRALTITGHGGVDRVQYRDDLPEPRLQHPGDILLRVQAAALNHLDLFVLEGIPGVTLTPGWAAGTDAVGIVLEAGSDVRGIRPGDRVVVNAGVSDRTCEYCLDGEQPLCPRYRVLGEHASGLAAEYVVLPAVNVRPVPDHVPTEVAAAFSLAAMTAWRMVVTRAAVSAGDDVLIWGIGGGVAQMALQICKARGARVWVTSGSDEKLARARAMGADETLNHRTQDVPAEIRARTGKRGVTVVVDSVGEATWDRSLRALGRRGRLVTCGGTSGPMVQTDVRRLFWNQWSLLGSTMANDGEFTAVVAELAAGRLTPVVDSVFPLAEGRGAYARLLSGEHFGKVVIQVAD